MKSLEEMVNSGNYKELHDCIFSYMRYDDLYKQIEQTTDVELIKKIVDNADVNVIASVFCYVNGEMRRKMYDMIRNMDINKKIGFFDTSYREVSDSMWYALLDDENDLIRKEARKKINGSYAFMHDYYHFPYLSTSNIYYLLYSEAYYSDKGKIIYSTYPLEKRYDVHMKIKDMDHPYHSPIGSEAVQRYVNNKSRKKDNQKVDGLADEIKYYLSNNTNKTSKSLNVKKGEDIELDKFLDCALSVPKKDNHVSDFANKKKIQKESNAILNCNESEELKKLVGDSDIEYGEYPQDNVSLAENTLLELLFKYGELEKTSKDYIVNNMVNNVTYNEYKVDDRKFIRYGYKNYIEVKPILWELDDNFLVSKQAIFPGKIDEAFLKKFFEESIPSKKHSLNKFSADDKIKVNQKIEEEKQNKMKALEDQMVVMLEQIKKTSEMYEEISNQKMGKRVPVELNQLLVKVDDHLEFNNKYIQYLKYIDLSLVPCDNLKVSGIDFRDTNMNVNPQVVFNKDLSNCSFDDNNIIWASFKGCNLSGANLENEQESQIFEDAITDERTILPQSNTMKM